MRRKWKCTQAKQSSVISSSANRSSKQRSLEKSLLHSFVRVYHAEKAWGAPRWGCGELLAPSAQHWGAGFLHPAPRMAAEDQHGREKPPRWDGGEQTAVPLHNLSKFSSPPGRTSLTSSHSRHQPSSKHPKCSLSPAATPVTLSLTEA